MDSNHKKESHRQPQQYQNILLPVVMAASSASSPSNTQQNASALNNNNYNSSPIAANSETNYENESGNSLPSTQITCDESNPTTISTFTTNIEQSAKNSDDRLTTAGCTRIEQRINSINLNEETLSSRSDCDRNNSDVTNNNATAIAVAAATRIPFELLHGNGVFSSAFPSLNGALYSDDGANLMQKVNEYVVASSSDTLHKCEVSNVVQCNLCQKKKKSHPKCCKTCNKDSKGKKANWSLRLNCAKLKRTASTSSISSVTAANHSLNTALTTPLFPSTATTSVAAAACANATIATNSALQMNSTPLCNSSNVILLSVNPRPRPLLDFTKFNPADYPIEDCDRKARMQRAIEIEEGIEPPPGFTPSTCTANSNATISTALFTPASMNGSSSITRTSTYLQMVCSSDTALRLMLPNFNPEGGPRIHSQIDFIHCLVPDLNRITCSTFYWGKMDRYEAERLLDGKPEGTFLLRDSAQEDFLFSVSFRKYGRSLHARIEQFNHKFSFDCHDPGVYTSSSVTGLLEHYKDPACVMFFEPALTLPLNRNSAFSLQQLCRAAIVSHTTYDGINSISLPKKLKAYLKEYHYKQRVRVKKED